MNYKNPEDDSGEYMNGIYTTRNGFSGLGLNCPRGQSLYNTKVKQAIFFNPSDIQEGEEFVRLTQDAAPNVQPYYAISNYGRIQNTYTGKILKPNYRNEYEYYCLSSDLKNEDGSCRQKKYNTSRLVMKTFRPCKNMDNLQVNHIYGDKTKNYVDKVMPDGTLDDALEWTTSRENCIHADKNKWRQKYKLSYDDAKAIRDYHDRGYSYEYIKNNFYSNVSITSIQNVCKNKIYYDPEYVPMYYEESYLQNPGKLHKLTDIDADKIRNYRVQGYSYEDIKRIYYPDFSISTISDICRNKTHNKR